jgi:uncharacterized protein YgiM (DUF1202 family)
MKLNINKKTKLALLFGVPILIGGYFIYKQFRKKPTPPNPNPPNPNPPSSDWKKYKVNTASTNLNVRSGASTSSGIVSSLAKDSIIWAKPTSNSGWYEYSSDGSTRSGFVSSQYLILA